MLIGYTAKSCNLLNKKEEYNKCRIPILNIENSEVINKKTTEDKNKEEASYVQRPKRITTQENNITDNQEPEDHNSKRRISVKHTRDPEKSVPRIATNTKSPSKLATTTHPATTTPSLPTAQQQSPEPLHQTAKPHKQSMWLPQPGKKTQNPI